MEYILPPNSVLVNFYSLANLQIVKENYLMIHASIVQKVRVEVDRIFEEEITDLFVYHNKAHTESVVNNCLRFASDYDISEYDRSILEIAGWFHDVGYSKGYENHEDSSEKIARAFLGKLTIPKEQIDQIAKCIQATKVETLPTNLLEEIIKDADLANLGEGTFFDHSKRLRQEWFTILDEYHTDQQWNELNQNFLMQHKYFTSAAINRLRAKKIENLEYLQKELLLMKEK
ncbi:MAG: HD domain-containing protein [Saprospiraceae bacterium]